MKNRSTLLLLAIIGIAAILLMQAPLALSTHKSGHVLPCPAILFGTESADIIDGDVCHDRIFGLDGRDTLDGKAGDDLIIGGEGADTIRGGPGNDMLIGEENADKIDGGPGDDKIYGGSNADALSGGSGNDEIWGGDNSDIIFGDSGNNQLFGGLGSDTIFGGIGDDIIFGGVKNDVLIAFGGDPSNNVYTGTVTCAGVLAGDTVIVNGLFYTAVTDPKTDDTEFQIDISDNSCAADLALSISDDTRTPVTVPTVGQSATSKFAVVTITADGVGIIESARIDLSSNDATRLAVSAPFLQNVDNQLFGGIGNDHIIGSLVAQVTLDGGEELDDDGDTLFGEDPVDFDQFGVPIDNDGDGFINEDGPDNDNDVCFWDGGPTQVVSDPDGIENSGDEIFGDDVLALDAFGDPTCEIVHVLGKDPIVISDVKKGGGKSTAPGMLSATFVQTVVETDLIDPEGDLIITFNKDISANPDLTNLEFKEQIHIGSFGTEIIRLDDAFIILPDKEPTVTLALDPNHIAFLIALDRHVGSIPTVTVGENIVVDKPQFGNGNDGTFIGISINLIDETPPDLIGAAFVTGSGVLTVAFDEPVDPLSVAEDKIFVREAGTSTGGELLIIASSSIVSVGNTLEITPSVAQQAAINLLIDEPAPGSNPIELDVLAGAVADLAVTPNLVLETNDTPITVQTDPFPPFILSATYDATFDIFKISFNENIDPSATNLDRIFVSNDGNFFDNPLSAGPPAATVTTVTGNPISITVNHGPTNDAIDLLLTPKLGVTIGAFEDLSGLPSIEQIVPITLSPTDLIGPVIERLDPDKTTFDITLGTLTITFDEQVDLTPDSQVDLTQVFVSGFELENEVDLGGATHLTSSDSTTFEIGLTDTQLGLIGSLLQPIQLDVSAGAFQDPKGNPILDTVDVPIDVIEVDITKPEIDTVDYDPATGLLTITFLDSDVINVETPGASDLSKVFVSIPNKRNQIQLSSAFFVSGNSDVIIINVAVHKGDIDDLIGFPPLCPNSIDLDVGKNAFTDLSGNRSNKDANIPINVTCPP